MFKLFSGQLIFFRGQLSSIAEEYLLGFVPLRLAAALSELKASEEPICRQNSEFFPFKRSLKVPRNPQRDPYFFMQGHTIVKIESHLLSQKYRKECPLDSIFFKLETSENPLFEKKRYRNFFRKMVSYDGMRNFRLAERFSQARNFFKTEGVQNLSSFFDFNISFNFFSINAPKVE